MLPAGLTAPFAATRWNVPPFSSTSRSPPGSTLTAVGAVNDPTSESVNPAGTASAGDADGTTTRKAAPSSAPVTIDLNIDLVRIAPPSILPPRGHAKRTSHGARAARRARRSTSEQLVR